MGRHKSEIEREQSSNKLRVDLLRRLHAVEGAYAQLPKGERVPMNQILEEGLLRVLPEHERHLGIDPVESAE